MDAKLVLVCAATVALLGPVRAQQRVVEFEFSAPLAARGPISIQLPDAAERRPWNAWRCAGDEAAARAFARELGACPPDAREVWRCLQTQARGGRLPLVFALQPGKLTIHAANGVPADPDPLLQRVRAPADATALFAEGDAAARLRLLPFVAVLGRGDPTTVAVLLHALASATPELRWRAALGLGWAAGTPAAREAEPHLVERLRDESEVVREFAAAALARIHAARNSAASRATSTR